MSDHIYAGMCAGAIGGRRDPDCPACRAMDGEPGMPGHPEPHTMRWTDLELRAIHAYGQAMAEHAQRVAMEDAAKLCDKLRADTLDAQSGLQDALPNVMLRQVAYLGHGECAAAIRAKVAGK